MSTLWSKALILRRILLCLLTQRSENSEKSDIHSQDAARIAVIPAVIGRIAVSAHLVVKSVDLAINN